MAKQFTIKAPDRATIYGCSICNNYQDKNNVFNDAVNCAVVGYNKHRPKLCPFTGMKVKFTGLRAKKVRE